MMTQQVESKTEYRGKPLPADLPKVKLTENQEKVIKDKYLKDAPSVEAWLWNIAYNLALADVLYMKEASEKEIFDGVVHKYEEHDSAEGKKSRILLLHSNFTTYNEWDQNFKKLVANLEKLSFTNPKIHDKVSKKALTFYNLMAKFEFLPNSPTLMNAGRDLQQLSACYVLPVGDSIEEIYDSVKSMAMVHKSGGGTGFDFSRLRAKNSPVKTTKGISSGPISFMSLFDKSTDVVKQGGTRRGANMGILRYDHPDIREFIHCKDGNNAFENFNISVTVDKKFMEAIKSGDDIDLINPKDKTVVSSTSAKALFDEMVESAWKSGDPGIIFIDRINQTESNPTPHIGMIESTNPCGEQPLLPYEPCNLGSINLYKFVDEKKKDFDWPRLKVAVHDATTMLDNVIDVNNYPIPKIEYMAKLGRRIGLGVMGWAESLVAMEIAYNSDDAYEKAEEVMKFINDESRRTSEEIAKERGLFPSWKGSIYDEHSKFYLGRVSYARNSAITTIAPTGTIGIAAGLQGAGIEPFFAVAYIRYNAAGIDALKKGETPLEKDTFYEVNPMFKKIAERYKFFGISEKDLYKKIEDNHKSLIGIPEIPNHIQNLFLTSHDIGALDHVRIQAAFQKYTDNAVSKTVNLKNNATVEDVREVYVLAYKLGAKGVTIYRDGCKQFQVLNMSAKKEEKKVEVSPAVMERTPTNSSYHLVHTGQGPVHIHINYDSQGPLQLFANLSPTGTEISGMTTAIGILASKYLQDGGDPNKLVKHLNSIKGDKPFGFGPKRVDSIPHGIAKALREHMISTGKTQGLNGQTMLQTNRHTQMVSGPAHTGDEHKKQDMFCSQCYSTNVEMVSGCSEPTCFDCGYSKCS